MNKEQKLKKAWADFLKRNSKKGSDTEHREIEDKSKDCGGDIEIDTDSETNLDFYVFSKGYQSSKAETLKQVEEIIEKEFEEIKKREEVIWEPVLFFLDDLKQQIKKLGIEKDEKKK